MPTDTDTLPTAPAEQSVRIITTRYRGPTNSRGSRVIASVPSTRVTVPWDHALNPDEMHALAARVLCRKLGWPWPTHAGNLDDGGSRVHVVPFGVVVGV